MKIKQLIISSKQKSMRQAVGLHINDKVERGELTEYCLYFAKTGSRN